MAAKGTMSKQRPDRQTGDPQRHPRPVVASWILAVAVSAFTLALVAIELTALFWEPHGGIPYFGDLGIYQAAVSYWVHGGQLYDYVYSDPHVLGLLGFTYPPFAALVFLPTAYVPMRLLAPVWTAGTYGLVAVLAATVAGQWRVRQASERCPSDDDLPRTLASTAFGAALLLLSYPVFHDIGVGQISLAITTLALLDALGALPRRISGGLVGIAGALKLTPLVFIPYFLWTRRRRDAGVAAGTFAGATALAFLVSPSTSITYWGSAIWDTSRVGQVWWPRNKSLMGLLARVGLTGHLLLALWLLLGLALSGLALHHAKRHDERGERFEATLVIGALSVVVSPISWPHHQTWAVLVAIWLVLTGRRTLKATGVALFAVFSLVSPLAGLDTTPTLVLRVADELPTLAFIAISALGLGRRPTSSRGEPPASDPSGAREGPLTARDAPLIAGTEHRQSDGITPV